MKRTIISHIAHYCDWHKTVPEAFRDVCEDRLETLEKELPNGSGIDSGCKIDIENSSSKKVVITFGWHHLNEDGYYDGWTQHKLIVKPHLSMGIDMNITGHDRNGIKEYLYELF